jgi:CDP-diacylglycerol--glycerol-3-phosphate 3-phosphatidyltransferase
MVVVVLARELFVTSMRGVLEARGVAFGADWMGKVKMAAQCVAIPFALMVSVNRWMLESDTWRTAQTAAVWGVVLITLYSVVPYTLRGARLLREIARGGNA